MTDHLALLRPYVDEHDEVLASGDWRAVMPVWAHRELWYLRRVWYGSEGPKGAILGAILCYGPERAVHEIYDGVVYVDSLPAITFCLATVADETGEARPYILYSPDSGGVTSMEERRK